MRYERKGDELYDCYLCSTVIMYIFPAIHTLQRHMQRLPMGEGPRHTTGSSSRGSLTPFHLSAPWKPADGPSAVPRTIPCKSRRVLVDLGFDQWTRVISPASNVPEYRREYQNGTQESNSVVHCVTPNRPDRRQDEDD